MAGDSPALTSLTLRGGRMADEHDRISCNGWAMCLRALRRILEHGETMPYAPQLDV
jgi:hypothetical protein